MKDKSRKLEQERNELNTMIGKGVTFEVDDVTFEVQKRFFGLIKKRVPKTIKRKFKVEEMTLATLDRLSQEWIEFAINESSLKTDDAMIIARTMSKDNAMRCAKVIAIAVLGENRLIPAFHKGKTTWVEDNESIEELTALFARQIKPSKLYQLYILINAMCNFGDFLNSIRLMQTERTTVPNLIEENNLD